MSSRTHPRAPTYIHPCASMHVRTYTRTRRKFSDSKSAIQHCQTKFHHQSDTIHFYCPIAAQSLSILAAPSVQTISICHSFTIHYHPFSNYPPTIYHLSLISHSLSPLTIISHASYSIFIQCPVQLTVISICQYVIKPCQVSIY